MITFKHSDGGREAAGLLGGVSDCVTRALANAGVSTYLNVRSHMEGIDPDFEKHGINIFCDDFNEYMADLGWHWVPMSHGACVNSFPEIGTFIALTKGHLTCIKDGQALDVFDCTSEVSFGYWAKSVSSNDWLVVNGRGTAVSSGTMNMQQAIKMRDLTRLNYKRIVWVV